MINSDFTKLSRKQLMEHFEQERQEWLAAGMNEADIFQIHFGKEIENGKGGDYRVWLNERKQIRPDHKYAPGEPISLDTIEYEGEWLAAQDDAIALTGFSIDLERALATLTELQRRYFLLSRIEGRSNVEIARLDSKHESTVRETIKAADKKIKNFFE